MAGLQIVKKVELEAQRAAGGRQGGGRRKRNPIEDLKREVAIMRKLRHKNITALQEVSVSTTFKGGLSQQRAASAKISRGKAVVTIGLQEQNYAG